MSYRLKRKRFKCEPCTREWNQLVGSDIDSVMCKSKPGPPNLTLVTFIGDICSNQSKVVM